MTQKTQCLDCASGKYSSGALDTCSLCPAGTYSNTVNTITCPTCPAGTFQMYEGQQACDTCPVNGVLISSTSGCKCNAGYRYTSSPLSCTACVPGKYLSTASQLSNCDPCSANRYVSTYAAITCYDCPALSTSVQASEECTCNTGYNMQSNVCVFGQCEIGKYLSGDSCVTCAAGKYKVTTGTASGAGIEPSIV